jgi:hypothetical protein
MGSVKPLAVSFFFIINLGLKIVRLRTLYWPMNCRYRGYGAHTLGGSYPKQRTQA